MKSNTKINCTELAKKAGISKAMVSQIFLGKKKAGWKSAKGLAAATGTDPVLWLEGTPNEIKQAIMEESDTLIKN